MLFFLVLHTVYACVGTPTDATQCADGVLGKALNSGFSLQLFFSPLQIAGEKFSLKKNSFF